MVGFINFRHKVISKGDHPSLRDSQSCAQIYNNCYIFGGQVGVYLI
jgi:hypothetical protein